MSFYWQNAVPQESGQPKASTWDNINLGGAPEQPQQQQQAAQQSVSYENQNQGGYEQYVNPYADQWAAYHAQQAALQEQQQQHVLPPHEAPVAIQPQIDHQPILAELQQPAVESQSTFSVPATDQTQNAQSNHAAYDGWGHEGWSSHEPSVEPPVQHTVDTHQYYAQQNQYYQDQISQQHTTIEQNWAPSEAPEVSSTNATLVESSSYSMDDIPMEVPAEYHPVVQQEMPQQSPQLIDQPQLTAPVAVFDMGVDDEIVETEENKIEIEMKQEPQEELAGENAAGWGEEWGDDEREIAGSGHLAGLLDGQPRTSTPSPVEEDHDPEPAVSPIEAEVKELPLSPSNSVETAPHLISSTFPSPPTILGPSEMDPPSAIDTKTSPLSPPLDRLHTENTQKSSPPASTDSWVEVSSSGSDAVQLSNGLRSEKGGMQMPELATSIPARSEKRSSVSSVIRMVENGVDRRREDSDSTHDSKRNVRDKFRDVKSQYALIFNRLDGHRSSGRDGNKTPTRVNPLLAAASHGGVGLGVPVGSKKSSTPKDYHQDSTYPPPLLNDISAIEPRMHLDQSVNMSMESRGYGEEFVDAYRKDRHRTVRSSRPASRAKNEYRDAVLESLPDRGERVHRSAYDHSLIMHPQYGYYPTGRYSLGRHSSMGMPHAIDPYDNSRRPHSTYDQAAHMRMAKSGRGAEYDAYEYVSSGEESEEEEELPNESDNEMRRISHAAAAHSRTSMGGRRGGRPLPLDAVERLGEQEIDLLRFVNMDYSRAKRILHELPPPIEFWTLLDPLQKVAFLYYTSLHRKHFPSAKIFQERFQLNYLPLKYKGYQPQQALSKVCAEMREHYNAKVASKQRAYEASQRQLFSDEYDRGTPESRKGSPHPQWEIPSGIPPSIRPILRSRSAPRFTRDGKSWSGNGKVRAEEGGESSTPPSLSNALPSILKKLKGRWLRFSDRPSVYDHNQTSDVDDFSNNDREPLKFRLPHAFAVFGPGGKMIQVQPSKSIGTVHMTDVHCIVKDREMLRSVALANNFKGPLFPGQTPPHVVRAYITRQMDRVRKSDLAQTDPRNDDIIDCLLIWQLLEKVVQQHGRVTGPDMAELLTRATQRREKREGGVPLEIAPPTADPKTYEIFCQYLLQGLVDDAINFAMKEGLYSDALSLARRLVPHRVDEIEKRHFATRPSSHPVLTLMAVASKEAAPCLSTMASEDRGGWRCHAAILFANLSTSPFAMETIRRLGEELARRDCNAAADFCFLSVALLADVDTFTPSTHDPVTGLPSSVRRHIELIHASIPDDMAESIVCDYGFSLTDLHATEIFDYGSRLSGGKTNLAISGPYQRRRIQYAKLLAGWGGFALESFRYCTEVARTMWNHMSLFTASELEELIELAERLHKVAAADEASTLWIDTLSQMIPSLKTARWAPALETQPLPSVSAPVAPPTQEQTHVQHDHMEERQRSDSISTEAAVWHARMGEEPLEMKGERKEEEERRRRESEAAMYAVYQQQQQEQHPQYSDEVITPESHHSAFHQEQPWEGHHHHHEQHEHESHSSLSHTTAMHSEYSSGTTTERGGLSSEESTPIRERSASIHSQPSHPNPLAPSLPPVPTAPLVSPAPSPPQRAPAPMPPMPSLPMVPTPAAVPFMQQQQQQPQLIKQETASSGSQPQLSQSGKGSNGGGGGGFFGGIASKLRTTVSKAVGNKEMILPDDSKKTIYYDEKLGAWVGDGVEQESAPPPPPSIPGSMNGLSGLDGGGGAGGPPLMMMGGGLKAARNSGGSRYFNPLNDASKTASSGPSGGPPMGMPAPPTFPTQFSFIPTMPDDAVTDSPFSERPVLPEGTDGQQEHSQQ